MSVVCHQRPGIDGRFEINRKLFKPINKDLAVLVIINYPPFLNSSNNDMMQGSGCIQTC
jgi:hypothetical protein